MMSDQLFNDSSTVGTTAEIPDIFDVLEGGEDEGAVRYLLGFNGEEGTVGLLSQVDTFGNMEVIDKYVSDGIPLPINGATFVPSVTTTNSSSPTITVKSPVTVRQITTSVNAKKRDTSGAKAIHNCDSCGKSFTTKFNLKRHINMHCHKSKENGVPIQGPPSASAPAKKSEKQNSKPEKQDQAKENSEGKVSCVTVAPTVQAQQTVLAQNQTANIIPVPYTRVVTVPQTEYQRPEPDSTYKLPSVQTILPVYTSSTTLGTTTFSTIASCDSSQPVPSVTSSSHNTDFGTLPADLFDPDSSQSQPPSPASPPVGESGSIKTVKDGADIQQPVTLTTVPSGWTKKLSPETGRVIFISPLGKHFSCHDEIVQYFKGFNFNVPLGLFDFDPRYLEDTEDEDETDEEDDDDLEDEEAEDAEEQTFCAKRMRVEVAGLEVNKTAGSPSATSPLASDCAAADKDVAVSQDDVAALYHPVPQSSVKNHQSQTYLTYIQGLRLGSDTMCDWSRELESTETLLTGEGHQGTVYLPAVLTASGGNTGAGGNTSSTPWLEYINTDSATKSLESTTSSSSISINTTNTGVNSLCALRDFMIQEALNVVKFA